jgi:formate/nitrite transporter FocA (FNT family)
MLYRCPSCDALNQPAGFCQRCGEKVGLGQKKSPLWAIVIVGLSTVIAGLLLFLEEYPPGSRVYMARSRSSFISTVNDLWVSFGIVVGGLVMTAVGYYLVKKKSGGR